MNGFDIAKKFHVLVYSMRPYLLIALVTVLAYANVLYGEFLYDDLSLITENPLLNHWNSWWKFFVHPITAGANAAGNYVRPLQMLTYLTLWHAFGDNPLPLHLLNLALHMANACLVMMLGKRLGFSMSAALAAALLWALHPLNTEAVSYISATADPLFSLFCLIGILAALPDFSIKRMGIAAIFFFMALLAKESAAVFPLMLLATLSYLHRDMTVKPGYRALWPLLAVFAFYAAMRITLAPYADTQTIQFNLSGELGHYSIWPILTYFATLPDYLSLIVWPEGLRFDRAYPFVSDLSDTRIWLGVIFTLISLAVVLTSRKKTKLRPLGWGLMWFFAATFLQNGIVVVLKPPFHEHFMYLPMVGLFLGVTETLYRLIMANNEKIKLISMAEAATVGACIALFLATHGQNQTWQTIEALCQASFAAGEPAPKCHNNLGIEYAKEGHFADALHELNLAVENSNDSMAEARANLAITMLNQPNGYRFREVAAMHLKRALELNPNFLHAMRVLEVVYYDMGEREKSAAIGKQADELIARSGAQ